MEYSKIEWTDEVIEEFWRYWSERTDTYFSEPLGATILRFTRINNVKIGVALDFGAGSGGLLAALSGENNRCYGLDFGQDAINRLTKRFAGDANVEAVFEATDAPKYAEFFDTIFLIETIEHMPDGHLRTSMECSASMLKPGGWLVVTTPNDENLAAAEVYCPVSKIAFHPMQHVRSWNRRSLLSFLTGCGFSEVKCIETDFQALPYHSKSEAIKRALKRVLYQSYKDPHLVAFARKPSAENPGG
jgi:2-polyprenyl-3-methyl-5-hydroxy-6-metoxy-1,4-benzoquinol methylase